MIRSSPLRLLRSISRKCSSSSSERLRLLVAFVAGFATRAFLDGFSPGSSSSLHSSLPFSLSPPFLPKTRYEVIRFDSYDRRFLYNNVDDDPRIGLTRHHKADLADMVVQADRLLNEREREGARAKAGARRGRGAVPRMRWTVQGYRQGWRRFDPTRGEEHKMIVDAVVGGDDRRRLIVTALKPFAPAVLTDVADVDASSSILVHFVVAVARLSNRFDDFVANYETVCFGDAAADAASPRRSRRRLACALIVVVFDGPTPLDAEAVANVRRHARRLRDAHGPEADVRVVETRSAFTRAAGMDLGAKEVDEDALVFFVDADVTFDEGFVERCQLLAKKGKTVYYPIVFSRYDPEIVANFSSPALNPSPDVVSKLSGHWVSYGFGMVCLYKRDFSSVGGYGVSTRGWGGEDVALYDRHVAAAPELTVWRACDPGLVHRFHSRRCDPALAPDQYRMCVGAAAESLGSRAQLANMIAAGKAGDRRGWG